MSRNHSFNLKKTSPPPTPLRWHGLDCNQLVGAPGATGDSSQSVPQAAADQEPLGR